MHNDSNPKLRKEKYIHIDREVGRYIYIELDRNAVVLQWISQKSTWTFENKS